MPPVNYEIIENVGVIRLNNPPVNALSQALREGIQSAIEKAQSDASQALLLICEGRTFIAGADISEFGKPPTAPSLPEVIAAIENSTKPVIAAMHGTALGGGFELALGCHYRCALASTKVGLPEVNLGLLPGAGGTQRVPRLAGVEAALQLISHGKPIAATEARELKLLDRIIDGDLSEGDLNDDNLLKGALDFVRELIAGKAPLRRAAETPVDTSGVSPELLQHYREKARGQLAPLNIVRCIEAAIELPVEEGLKVERQLFTECLNSSQSRAMRHLFFAERESARVKGQGRGIQARDVRSVAIIGGGTMGGGIAMNFANAGIPVTLLEVSDEPLQRGMGLIEKNYGITVKKGKLSEAQKDHCLSLIRGTTDYGDLADADLVIEAVFEDLNRKQEVFARLDRVCKNGAILATNTSYQDVNLIAAATSRPRDVVGLHFFSPANVMKLLEVVRADKTAEDVIATAMRLAKTIGKVPVLSGVCYGFIGNRMLRHYAREAQLCLIEGASPEQIDGAMESWGMAMGPLAVGDLAGLDIGYKARQALSDEQKGPRASYCIADVLVEMGRLGQKSGTGYYRYDAQTRARSSDPEILRVVEEQAQKLGIQRRSFSDGEIVLRMIYALINEGAKILQEGIAQRPGDIDVVYIYGYGFPRHRGGPMQYADEIGLKKVCAGLRELHQTLGGDYWKPAELLEELAQSGLGFGDWAAAE